MAKHRPAVKSTTAPRRGWREPIEPGIYRIHRVACPSSADEKPGRRCGCPYSVRVPGDRTSRTLKVEGTREDARRERAKRVGAGKQADVVITSGPKTVHELAADYFAANASSWQPSTVELNDGLYKSWVMPKFGDTIAATIAKTDVAAWMASGRAMKAPRRADQALALLRRILGHAVDTTPPGLAQNVALGVKPPKAAEVKRATLTPAEADRLVDACKTPRDRVLVLLGLDAGLRMGEIRGLRWSDIDVDAKLLRIRTAIWSGKGRVRHEKSPKSGKSRPVALSPRLEAALLDLRKAEADGWVLPGRGDQPLARKSGYQALSRIAERAKLEGVDGKTLTGTHRLRRASATHALLRGVPLPIVSMQLGHADPKITAQAYSKVLDELALKDYFSDGSVREAVRERPRTPRSAATKRRRPK